MTIWMVNHMSHRNPPKSSADWRTVWKAHNVLATSAAQRRAIPRLPTGHVECHYCHKMVTEFDADHMVALHTIPQSKLEQWPECLWYWTIENIVPACKSCHRKKSANEQTANAKVKRIVKKRTGQHKAKVPFRKLTEDQKQAKRDYARAQRKKLKERCDDKR